MDLLLVILCGVIASVSCLSIRTFQMTLQRSARQFQLYQAGSFLLSALIYFCMGGSRLPADSAIWLLALGFGLCLSSSGIATAESYLCGPMSLTGIIISCNVVLPIAVGCLVYQESLQLPHIAGFVLLLATFLLPALGSSDKASRIHPRWYPLVLLSFLGNGAGSVILSAFTKMGHTSASNGFLGVGFLSGALMLLVFLAVVKLRRPDTVVAIRLHPLLFILLAVSTVSVFGANALILYLNTLFPASILYPLYNTVSSVLVCLISWLVFREPMNGKKLLSILLGIGAVILLNL